MVWQTIHIFFLVIIFFCLLIAMLLSALTSCFLASGDVTALLTREVYILEAFPESALESPRFQLQTSLQDCEFPLPILSSLFNL